jgi:hypothetical protein
VSDTVDWNTYGGETTAKRQLREEDTRRPRPLSPGPRTSTVNGNSDASRLRRDLNDWIAATNGRDIERQMTFYMPALQAFYLTRNTSRSSVRAEKLRAFSTARSIDIRAEEPEIIFQDGGRTAVMRFRKEYRIVDRVRTRSGEVVQELRWQRTPDGWRIYSERDVRVIR